MAVGSDIFIDRACAAGEAFVIESDGCLWYLIDQSFRALQKGREEEVWIPIG